MHRILVVDDSSVDRKLAGGLLEKEDELTLEYATNGIEALEVIERERPEVVVTDLRMPDMDGLELVAKVSSNYPGLPVILMTSQGSEEIAVQALKRGASSYVPKRRLANELVPTVRQLLQMVQQERRHERMLSCMTRSDCSFVLENDRQIIPPLVNHLQDTVVRLGLCDEVQRMRIGVALEEAMVNALHHGNLDLSSDLREEDYDAYYALVEERRHEAPYRDRRIYVEAKMTSDEASFVIRDEGKGFDPTSLPDPTDPANLEKVSGRGILLMRTFADEVSFNETGNAVTLIKRRETEQSNGQGE